MKNVIISTDIRFTTAHDVRAYSGLTSEARPRLDVEFTEATKVVVGWDRIVLFGATGQRMAVLNRRDYVGMAIDGKPYVISGDGFAPFTYDEAADIADRQLDYSGIHSPDDDCETENGETCEACNIDQYVEQ